jgi:hypothetical protein
VSYIVTSSTEYNSGLKETQRGQDRFLQIVLPVILETTHSIHQDYHIDIYLILGYTLSDERIRVLRSSLPYGVGLQIWHTAKPLNYDYKTKNSRNKWISEMPITLSRQHRYVLKDKLPYYDFFVVFEDDMLITKQHIHYYRQFTKQLQKYYNTGGQDTTTATTSNDRNNNKMKWYGPLSKDIIERIKPGFLRVEVLTNRTIPTYEPPTSSIQPNLHYGQTLDPSLCCHHSRYVTLNGQLAPPKPTNDELIVWETSIDGLSVRQMPVEMTSSLFDWVVVLPIHGVSSLSSSSYWSGDALGGTHPLPPPSSSSNEYFGQSAGYMSTAREIWEYQTKFCKGLSSFLPPFDPPRFEEDGMSYTIDNVEYWSGGMQLYGQTCELQRIVSVNNFSNHLLYHTANNKQKEISRDRLVRATTLLGQLYTVQQTANRKMLHDVRKDTTTARSLWYHSLFE